MERNNAVRNSLPGLGLALVSMLPSMLSNSPAEPDSRGITPAAAVGPVATTESARQPAKANVTTKSFSVICELPFDRIKTLHSIDGECGREGSAEPGPHQEQNKVKNNFCASGTPTPITFETFVKLQTAADSEKADGLLKFGSSDSLPDDRSVLRRLSASPPDVKVGEGSLVSFVAFVIDAKNSNVGNGESNNCDKNGKENNDIHIELGNSSDDEPCESVTAEISPHFRPAAWEKFTSTELIKGHPVRITGQLFFDASHTPCHDNKRPNPKRLSIWEIHPVYAIDVCKKKTLEQCSVTADNVWVPYDEYISDEDQ